MLSSIWTCHDSTRTAVSPSLPIPTKNVFGLIPLGVGLVLCWVLVLASIFVTVMGAQQNWIGAAIVLTSTATFGFCLSLISIGLVRDSYRDYVLELTDSEVVLVVIDRLRKQRGTKMIILLRRRQLR